jgi:hypothetical protein
MHMHRYGLVAGERSDRQIDDATLTGKKFNRADTERVVLAHGVSILFLSYSYSYLLLLLKNERPRSLDEYE